MANNGGINLKPQAPKRQPEPSGEEGAEFGERSLRPLGKDDLRLYARPIKSSGRTPFASVSLWLLHLGRQQQLRPSRASLESKPA